MAEQIQLGAFFVDIIDNPLETIAEDEQKDIIKQCIPVARKGFDNPNVTETDIYTHVFEGTTLVFVKNGQQEIVGFGGAVQEDIGGNPVLHLKGTAILPKYQGLKFYNVFTPARILREEEKTKGSFYVGSRTQSPKVFQFMSQKFGLFPRVDESIPENFKDIAEGYATLVQEKHSDFMSKQGVVFDRDTFIVKRAYGGFDKETGEEYGFCMYADNLPKAYDERINKYLSEHCDFNNGDAIILLGPFDRERSIKSLESVVAKHANDKRLLERFKN